MDLDLIVKLIGSLAVVVGLLLATLYVMKRQGFVVNDDLQIESSLSIGTKEKLLIIKCGEEKILLGVTASNIRTLHVLSSDTEEGSIPDKFDEAYKDVMEQEVMESSV